MLCDILMVFGCVNEAGFDFEGVHLLYKTGCTLMIIIATLY